jgi:hypothetical protein
LLTSLVVQFSKGKFVCRSKAAFIRYHIVLAQCKCLFIPIDHFC